MTQEQLDALLAEIGGGRLSYAPSAETKKITNPARIRPDGTTDYLVPKEIEVTIQRWHDPASGRVVEAYQSGDRWTVTRNTTDKSLVNVGGPAAASRPAPRNINGVPHEVVGQDENGQNIWAPVQTQQGPAQAAPRGGVPANATPRVEGSPRPDGTFDNEQPIMVWRTPDGQMADSRPLTGPERTQWEQDRQRSRNPGNKTDEQLADERKAGEPKITIKEVKQPDGSTKNVQVRVYPDGREEVLPSAIPGDPAPQPKPPAPNERGAPVRGGDGKLYYPVRQFNPQTNTVVEGYVDEQGNPTGPPPKSEPQRNIQTVTRDGVLYEVVPGQNGGPPTLREIRDEGAPAGRPTTRAPSLPQIVLGRSQEALRQAYDEIQAEVDAGRRSPAWGEARRREVKEAAQMTVDEGRLGLQDDQYNRSMAFNIANARLQYGQNAFENAMRFALSINDKIEPGSAAGANLFRASFMLQMQMMRDSGIMNVPGRGQTSPILRGVESQGAGSTQAQRRPPIIADIDHPERMVERSNQIAENIKAGLEASGAPREYTPASATTPGREPLVAPATPPAAPAAHPAASAPIPREPVLTSPMQAPGTGPALRVRDPYGNEFEMTQQQIDNRPNGSGDLTVLGPAVPQARAAPEPDMATLYGHTPDNPLITRPNEGVTLTPPRFAALERFRMGDTPPATGELPAPAVVPPNPADPTLTGAMPNALKLAQIRATPPWRIDPLEIDNLIRMGVPEQDIFSVPSMGVPA